MRRRAFTLLEMIVVVGILSVTAALLWPRFAALEAGQQARDLESALMRLGAEARLIAIETGQTVRVTYDDEQRAFLFNTLENETAAAEQRKTVPIPELAVLTTFTVGNAFVSAADWVLEYAPDGTGTDGAIEVEQGNTVYYVTIKGEDGSATKVEGQLEETDQTEWQAGELENRTG